MDADGTHFESWGGGGSLGTQSIFDICIDIFVMMSSNLSGT